MSYKRIKETQRAGLGSKPIWSRVVMGAMLVMGVTVGTSSAASAKVGTSYSQGVFSETSAGAGLGYDINGSATMVIDTNGTSVKAGLAGLDSAKVYGAHLHNGACADGGGGHYQDEEGGATTPPNELWVVTSGTVVEPDGNGFARAGGSATWQARISGTATLARSVVVHEPGGARIACADLAPRTTLLRGVFSVTSVGAGLGYDINGSATMVIDTDGTSVKAGLAGLDSAKVYGAHLHNGACADGGGGHYQDEEGGATTPPNELWVVTSGTVVEPDGNGFARAGGSATWQARISGTATLARSVVVHEPGGARIACADLRQIELTGPFAGMSGLNGSIARIYVGVFRRQPDTGGHAYWVGVANGGKTVSDIAGYFTDSLEFRQTYGQLDDPGFVDLLYANVMGRRGDMSGVSYWNGILAGGTPRATVILSFTESSEFKVLTKTS